MKYADLFNIKRGCEQSLDVKNTDVAMAMALNLQTLEIYIDAMRTALMRHEKNEEWRATVAARQENGEKCCIKKADGTPDLDKAGNLRFDAEGQAAYGRGDFEIRCKHEKAYADRQKLIDEFNDKLLEDIPKGKGPKLETISRKDLPADMTGQQLRFLVEHVIVK